MENFDQYYEFILNRGSTNGGHSLEKIKSLLEYFDNPQDKIKVIHIAGTNGKGSTANMIANTLSRKNRVGLFTSPYMTKINEAISISGVDISDEDFAEIIDRLKKPLEELDKKGLHNSYFEVLTAIMYIYFYEKKVDVAVVEVGLGGSLDSTNIIKSPIACVITTISKDHIQILGDSLEEIAQNKAGIIKDDSEVFLYPKEGDVEEVFVEKVRNTSSRLHTFDKTEIEIIKTGPDYNEFSFRSYKNIRTRLVGLHQIYNAVTALITLDFLKEEFKLSNKDIYDGLLTTRNPGRLELINKNPRVLVDGSHNREAIDALINAISSYKYRKLIVGFSILKDKDYNYIINSLAKIADEIIVTKIKNNPRAFDTDELYKLVKDKAKDAIEIKDPIEAYEYSKEKASEDDLVLWCGSLYLVGDILKYEKAPH
ncbi:MAG: bifunctional folylpolyglutamate synthase/dihydrofolate synthase [Anaerococcus sp.]|uniref:bifunctional folylpolyglutamate synthase/dihydrofolate synthase n=1 Tax=Anaerococcus sp. TaxID=1872515 RepID=UPI002609C7E7|nr:folylpolyglutamate synthase/dihydrofolate synthase family protein [Anaerococcus sp.]MCI5971945.1 bifunctional folylpolyglutamate synthase/dihydrofolate synthase [Anaerococcus sp.]MDD6918751.1 bifunctional folylpolyglutamate synthase/dihydrofolate synthase [Peptoniphilaceae bacterium]MDY2928204.1 folylpolyglutamate synthase/dihydrofolate synthase family protein [Anaerococcus sp.]